MVLARLTLVAAAALLSTAAAHSWPECFNWQFSDPAAYKDPARRRFTDSGGSCQGYPRNWDRANRLEGDRGVASLTGPCGDTPYGSPQFGPRPAGKVGEIMCVNWPAKNHYSDTNNRFVRRGTDGSQVENRQAHIGIASTANTAGTNADFKAGRLDPRSLNYRDCPVEGQIIPGRPSSGDQARGDNPSPGSDLMMCGGCFTIPNRSPGVYDMQWLWTLNDNEDYFACASLEILTGACTDPNKCSGVAASPTAPPPPSPAPACADIRQNWHWGDGGDGGIATVQPSYQACAQRCSEDPQCLCFAWDMDDSQCWLKTAALGGTTVCASAGSGRFGIVSGKDCHGGGTPPTPPPTFAPAPPTPRGVAPTIQTYTIVYEVQITVNRPALSGDALNAWIEGLRVAVDIPPGVITQVRVTNLSGQSQSVVTFSTGGDDYATTVQNMIAAQRPELAALDIVAVVDNEVTNNKVSAANPSASCSTMMIHLVHLAAFLGFAAAN